MKFGVFIGLLLLVSSCVSAQPFAKEIAEFKTRDSAQFPPKHAILFIGSSSFTKWKDVQDYFPGYTIVNRGFGGSTLLDQIRYVNDIVFPYKPKQVVIYCGENDVASSDTITAQTVYDRFVELFTLIRKKLPKVPIAFVSLKPSPSREKFGPTVVETNRLIRAFISGKKKAAFIDVYSPMLDEAGKYKEELFLEDRLHMKKEGYVIWKEAIEPYLKK